MGWAGLRTLDEGQSLKYDLVPLDDGRMMADQLSADGDRLYALSKLIVVIGGKGYRPKLILRFE